MPDKGRETSSRVGIAGLQRDKARCDVIPPFWFRFAGQQRLRLMRRGRRRGKVIKGMSQRSDPVIGKKLFSTILGFISFWLVNNVKRPHKDFPFRPFSPSCRVGEKSSSYCNELGKLHMGRIAHEEVSSLRMISCLYCSCKRRSLSSRFSCGSCTRRGTLKQPRDQDSKVPK